MRTIITLANLCTFRAPQVVLTNVDLIPALDAGGNIIPVLTTASRPWEYPEVGNPRVINRQVALASALAVAEGTDYY